MIFVKIFLLLLECLILEKFMMYLYNIIKFKFLNGNLKRYRIK